MYLRTGKWVPFYPFLRFENLSVQNAWCSFFLFDISFKRKKNIYRYSQISESFYNVAGITHHSFLHFTVYRQTSRGSRNNLVHSSCDNLIGLRVNQKTIVVTLIFTVVFIQNNIYEISPKLNFLSNFDLCQLHA